MPRLWTSLGQRVNYHLRALEDHGLVRLVEQRQRRGLTERLMIASARSYVPVADRAWRPQPLIRREPTVCPARYLVAVAARIVQDVADLIRQADKARAATGHLGRSITEIRFASAADRVRLYRGTRRVCGFARRSLPPSGITQRTAGIALVVRGSPQPET